MAQINRQESGSLVLFGQLDYFVAVARERYFAASPRFAISSRTGIGQPLRE